MQQIVHLAHCPRCVFNLAFAAALYALDIFLYKIALAQQPAVLVDRAALLYEIVYICYGCRGLSQYIGQGHVFLLCKTTLGVLVDECDICIFKFVFDGLAALRGYIYHCAGRQVTKNYLYIEQHVRPKKHTALKNPDVFCMEIR